MSNPAWGPMRSKGIDGKANAVRGRLVGVAHRYFESEAEAE